MDTMERGRCSPAQETLERSRAERPGRHAPGRPSHHYRPADGGPGATPCTGDGQWHSVRATRADLQALYTTKPGGTGLGLYIVQEIMAAHGGQIVVQSAVWQGTTFTLTFPYL